MSDVPEISVEELAADRDAYVIDVRTPGEFAEAHVPGAHLIPLDELEDRIDEVPADRGIRVICQVGGRSARATEFLNAAGRDATNVAGGTSAWVAAGLPTEAAR